MKKLLLSIVFALVTFTTSLAVDLNPFAYNLYTSKEASGHTKLHFYLNAPANRVQVIIMNGGEEYILRDYTNVAYHPNGYGTVISDNDINNLNLQLGINYSWKVVVYGTSQTSPKLTTQAIPFYCPHALAIDNNPNSKHFGRVLVAESRHGASSSGCISSVNGTIQGGIYALRPELEYTDGGTVYTSWYDPNNHVFTGGKDFTRQIVKDGVLHLDNNCGLQPYMVRISDDGRIFVSSGDARADGCVVWELDPDNLNSWTDLIKGKLKPYQGEDLTLPASNGIYQVFDASGNFVAGLNCSMDVKGSGENLKLALYSTDKRGMTKFVVENFRLHEYAIGNSKTFTGTPTHIPHFGKTRYGHLNSHAKLFYDGDNGFWFGGYNSAGDDDIIFAHARKSGNDYIRKSWGDNSDTYFGGGGVKTHVLHNGEEILFKGVNNNKLLFYKVDRSTGIPVLTSKSWGFSLSNLAHARCNDFVVDYADNLYLVDNNNEQLMTVALPYSGIVSTPAASKYTFEITNPNYDHPENHLAPFAYDLRKTIEGDGRTKLHFMLNAHARKVQVVLIDETKEDGDPTKEIILREYPNAKSEYKDFIPYHTEGYGTVITTEDVETLGLDYGKNYSWRVDVWGKDVAAPNCAKSYSFYHPSAVDIDNNPENPNFGMIITNECQHDVKTISGYMGTGYGAGIYAFTADFKPIKNADEQYGFNGGNVFTIKRADNNSENAYAPRRIRISDDGRIFVTSLNTNGDVLWEVDTANLNQWTPVFQGLTQNTNKDLVSGSTFVAGPNAGFDVRGSGPDLQLLMLSANTQTYGFAQKGFRISEYNLGNHTTWNTNPSKDFPPKDVNVTSYFIVGKQSQVQYDKDGGVWYIQYRSGTTEGLPGLVYFDKDGNEKKKWLLNNINNAGFRFNHDFTKVVIAGVESGAANSKKATIYAVSKDANGVPILEKELEIDMSVLGASLNDFAWDYAGNLYACGNENGKFAVYVMPRSASDRVSTPARDGEMVNLTQPVPRIVAYNLTYRPNGANQTYDFSFYSNTQPTGGSISFYKNGEITPLYVHQISNLVQGDNTVSIPMATLDAALNLEKDITWELTLSAPESQVFGKIYKSDVLNTAYATINTNPATDYFGHVYAGNQQNHVSNGSGGNIYVWAPGSGTNNNQGDRYHTIKTAYTPTLSPNDKKGFTQVSAPGIAPDGKVYFTDNGRDGGVYVMDPKDYSITSFFEGLAQNEIAQYLYNSNPVGTPSSSAHIYWPGGNTAKLFLVSTEYYTKSDIGSQHSTLHRHNAGYYIYTLTEQNGQWVHNRNWGETQKVAVTKDNIYQPNFTIVGTSHGAWYCQHRRNDLDVDESRSLMFFDNNGVRQYCSTDDDEIYGSCGSAIAVNKEETLLAMASGLGGIMFFDIAWSGDIPTLTYKYTSALNNNDVVTTLNFDYNGNLVATVGDTYNDATDKHRMVVFTMPKEGENTVTVPARFSQRVAALYADERMAVHFDEDITNESPYQTVDVFRRLQAGMCNTICLPFSLESLENTPYKNATVFAFAGVTEGNDQLELQFTEVTFGAGKGMRAGIPYLIQPENDITDLLRFSPVEVNANFINNEALSVTYDGITYHGTINPKRLEVDKNYLFLVANNRLATASAGGDMLGLRGYFTVNGELPAKAVISFKEGVTTGTTSTVVPTTDGVQKVLHDQQILIIRDGETYNILGEHINTK